MDLIRRIYYETAKNNFALKFQHVPGADNPVADTLSRFETSKFRQLHPLIDEIPLEVDFNLHDLAGHLLTSSTEQDSDDWKPCPTSSSEHASLADPDVLIELESADTWIFARNSICTFPGTALTLRRFLSYLNRAGLAQATAKLLPSFPST